MGIGELNAKVEGLLTRAEAADQSGSGDEQLPTELAKAEKRRARLVAAKAENPGNLGAVGSKLWITIRVFCNQFIHVRYGVA